MDGIIYLRALRVCATATPMYTRDVTPRHVHVPAHDEVVVKLCAMLLREVNCSRSAVDVISA